MGDMKYISIRGNTSNTGSACCEENTPPYIDKAIEEGFDVMVDVWFDLEAHAWFAGGESPTHNIQLNYLKHPNIICNAKTVDTFNKIMEIQKEKQEFIPRVCFIWPGNEDIVFSNNIKKIKDQWDEVKD